MPGEVMQLPPADEIVMVAGTPPMFYKVSLADKLAQSLVAEISRGSLKRGAQLPTETELCELHGVSRNTVRRALDALQKRG